MSHSNKPFAPFFLMEIFLAASSRGEKSVLVLETRMKTVNIKYRSVDTVAGAPATTDTSATPCIKRKITPARARRSKFRLDEFVRKKQGEKASLDHQQTGENHEVGSQVAGNTSSITRGGQLETPAAPPTSWSSSCPTQWSRTGLWRAYPW